jgi:N-acetylglucosaminyldiphosphoundecaprenol N-acetyl-beta-D-mannosaminyltransferase
LPSANGLLIQSMKLQESGRAPIEESRVRYILGMRVDATNYDAATDLVMGWASRGESRCVCEAPINVVMECYDHPDLRRCINEMALVTPGGMPIVWLMRLLGVRRQPRVYGPDLTLRVCETAARAKVPVGCFGGTPEVARDFVRNLEARYPGLPVVFVYAPPFRPLTSQEDQEVCAQIAASGCRILFVGLGCPKQERWMDEHRDRIRAVMLGVGAAFDFISGHKPQAPRWLQAMGGEWLFRLATEPRRLWRRYAYHNPRFVVLAAGQLLQHWLVRHSGVGNKVLSVKPLPMIASIELDRKRCSHSSEGTEPRLDFDHYQARRLSVCPWQFAGKRLLDWLVAIGLLILLAPAFVVISIGVKLSSPGPVFFRQEREGLGGRRFVILKFRSMRTGDASEFCLRQAALAARGILVKSRTDPRVTGFGRWLRVTSLDELPQLLNVLRGDMSLVGPRPLIPFMLEADPAFRRVRALVRPGITGLWQVRDRTNNTTAAAMLPHDLDYIENFSLRQDLIILLRTIPAVLAYRGAF